MLTFWEIAEVILGELKKRKSDRSFWMSNSVLCWKGQGIQKRSAFQSEWVFYCCYNEATQACLKTALIYSLMVLEVKSSKFKELVRLGSSWRLWGKSISLPSLASGSCLPSRFMASSVSLVSVCISTSSSLLLSSYTCKDHGDYSVPTQTMQDDLPISVPLT